MVNQAHNLYTFSWESTCSYDIYMSYMQIQPIDKSVTNKRLIMVLGSIIDNNPT